ncbi:MAG: hypothetical protein FJ319_09830 [SAR202 cluster bacterium]|nr:hypothetical protein [SAR202 cluster bacterium]
MPLSATAFIHPGNNLIANISGELDRPGLVYVEYWTGLDDRLTTRPVDSQGTRFNIHAVRLRAETEYEYRVLGYGTGGATIEGPGGRFTTGPLPEGLQEASFTVVSGRPTHPLTFLEFRQESFLGLVAIDGAGNIVWYYEGPDGEQPWVMARRSENGNVVYIAGHRGGTTGSGLVEIDALGNQVARLEDECAPFGPIHHEVQILPDGRVLYLSRAVLRPGYGAPLAPQEGDTIGIWDPATGKNEIVWNIFDHISPADRTSPNSNFTLPGHPIWGGCDRDESVQDWSHGNSATVAADGTVLVSLGHLNQVVLISADFKDVLWRLGGPGSDFSFLDDTDAFYGQHTAWLLPNGNVLLFDNGGARPREEGGRFSRALELRLNQATKVASVRWEYRAVPPKFSECCSSAQRLDGGNTLVLFGGAGGDLCCREFTIVEEDSFGLEAWKVVHISPGKPNQYRVYPADSIMGEAPAR